MTTARLTSPGRTLVVGLGSADRGDDAVGGHVTRAVAALDHPHPAVTEHADPTDLIEVWSGYDEVVVVDATCSGDRATAPGTVRVLVTGAGMDPLPEAAWARTGRGGTHAFGLAAAVELARVLGRLPRRLTVVGVEAGSFEPGAPLTPAVAAAVPDAVDAALRAVTTREEPAGVPR